MVASELATFAALLKPYRLAAGLTQEELAARANLSVRGISNLEREVRPVVFRRTLDSGRWILALCLAGLMLGGLPLAVAHAAAPHHPTHVLARHHGGTRHTQLGHHAASAARGGACGLAWG